MSEPNDDDHVFLLTFASSLREIADRINEETQRAIKLIDSVLESTAPATLKIDVPWMSQLGDKASYGSGDCAEACVAMLLRYYERNVESVDVVSKAAGLKQGFTLSYWWDAVRAAGVFGLILEHAHSQTLDNIAAELQVRRPVIALLDYQSIPIGLRSNASYNAGHFVVVVGLSAQHVYIHDPYWQTATLGSYLPYPRADFEKSWATRAPGNTLSRQVLYIRAIH